MKTSFLAVALLPLIAPAGAEAATVITFNGVCAGTANATQAACTTSSQAQTSPYYGNTATLTATNDSTLQVKLSAWQANQSTNKVTKAYLGAYSGGFGVTGVQDVDANGVAGGNATHQIDNVNGYTDFVMLQFSRAVSLVGLNLNLYSPYTDSDSSVWNGSVLTPSVWNSNVDITGGTLDPTVWSNTAGGSTSGYRNLTTSGANAGFSQVWLVAASTLTTDRNDGFKLAQLMVTPMIPAIPEPATWAMMIAGFGLVGASMRRSVRIKGVAAA